MHRPSHAHAPFLGRPLRPVRECRSFSAIFFSLLGEIGFVAVCSLFSTTVTLRRRRALCFGRRSKVVLMVSSTVILSLKWTFGCTRAEPFSSSGSPLACGISTSIEDMFMCALLTNVNFQNWWNLEFKMYTVLLEDGWPNLLVKS